MDLLMRSHVNSFAAIIQLQAVTILISRSHPLLLLFLPIVLNTSECLKLTAAQVPCAHIRTTTCALSCTGFGNMERQRADFRACVLKHVGYGQKLDLTYIFFLKHLLFLKIVLFNRPTLYLCNNFRLLCTHSIHIYNIHI